MCLRVWSVDVESPDTEFYDLVCVCVWSVDVESPDTEFHDLVCVCVCGLLRGVS